ncbi:MAG: PDZ domain-containing protein [Defluviitaleaceae bacterium]|nr:PDZ domain-containing protein [Defluviitaleaceae bacterium]
MLESMASTNLIFTPFILLILAAVPKMDKRYAPAGRYALWIIVTVGLMWPLTAAVLPRQPLFPIEINIQSPSPAEIPRSFYVLEAWTLPTETAHSNPTAPMAAAPVMDSPAQEEIPRLFSLPQIDPLQALLALWIAGMFAFAAFQFLRQLRLLRFLKRWRIPAPAHIAEILHTEKQRIGVRKNIPVFYAKDISSPMLTGLLKPAIFLKEAAYSTDELKLIFRHELFHYKHRHLWCKLALLVVRCLYWYNPAAHLMARQADKDMEALCDNAVIQGADINLRKLYGNLILRLAAKPVYSPLTTNISGGSNMLKQRLFNIFNGKKRSNKGFLALMGVLIAALGLLVGFQFVHGEEMYEYVGYAYADYSHAEYGYPDYEPCVDCTPAYEYIPAPPVFEHRSSDSLREEQRRHVEAFVNMGLLEYFDMVVPAPHGIWSWCEETESTVIITIDSETGEESTIFIGYVRFVSSLDEIVQYVHHVPTPDNRVLLGIFVKGVYCPETTDENGVVVLSLQPGMGAYKSGILVGDIIVSVDGIAIYNTADLGAALYGNAHGQVVAVGVYRDGVRMDFPVVLSNTIPQNEYQISFSMEILP